MYNAVLADRFPDCTPIFVIGAPRSGTTLLQRILDAHPDIALMDEVTFFATTAINRERRGLSRWFRSDAVRRSRPVLKPSTQAIRNWMSQSDRDKPPLQ